MRARVHKPSAAGGGRWRRRGIAAMGGAAGVIALVVVLATSMSAGAAKPRSYDSGKAQTVASRDHLGLAPRMSRIAWNFGGGPVWCDYAARTIAASSV